MSKELIWMTILRKFITLAGSRTAKKIVSEVSWS
jgi:hypothetical protein